jgi:hypothetical protein
VVKQVTVIGVVLGLVMMMAGPIAAANAQAYRYDAPTPGHGDIGSICLEDAPASSCVVIPIQPGDTWITLTIEDHSGLDTYATVGQDYNDDGLTDLSQNFCDTVRFPVQDAVPLGAAEVIVFVHAAPGLGNEAFAGNPSPCVGVGTSGYVIVDRS